MLSFSHLFSAYAQPSLTEGPQEAEALPWEPRSQSSNPSASPLPFGAIAPRKSSSSSMTKIAGSPIGLVFDSSLREPLNVQAHTDPDRAVAAALFGVEEQAQARAEVPSGSSSSRSSWARQAQDEQHTPRRQSREE